MSKKQSALSFATCQADFAAHLVHNDEIEEPSIKDHHDFEVALRSGDPAPDNGDAKE